MGQEAHLEKAAPAGAVGCARALVEPLRALAKTCEQQRDVPAAAIALLREAGLLRLYQPAAFGGSELAYGRPQLEICQTIGSVSASIAWVQSGIAVHAWMLGTFPIEAQEAAWRQTPDAHVATAVAYEHASSEPVDGGFLLTGRWQFSSGCSACDWIIVRAPVKIGGVGEMRLCLLSKHDVTIIDVWNPIGLRGTGSNDVEAKGVFVPLRHTVNILSLRGDGCAIGVKNPSPLFTMPFMALFPYTVAAPAVGVAMGALEAFRLELLSRPDRLNNVSRQVRFSEAAAEIECARLLMAETGAAIEDAIAKRRIFSATERATAKRNTGYAARLCREAVALLVEMLGAHGVRQEHPVQHAYRDLLAISSHMGLNWDNSGEIYGRASFGLAPTDPMA